MGERRWWYRLGRLRIEVRPNGEIPLKNLYESEPMRVIRFGVAVILVCYSLNMILKGEIKAFLIATVPLPVILCLFKIYLWYRQRRQDASMPGNDGAG